MPLREYERRVRELHETAPPDLSGPAQEKMRRAELALLVRHTLGPDFPRARIDALFQAHQRFHAFMLWHIALAGLKKLCLLDKRPLERLVADKMKRRFSSLLDDRESGALFGVNETLPRRAGR